MKSSEIKLEAMKLVHRKDRPAEANIAEAKLLVEYLEGNEEKLVSKDGTAGKPNDDMLS